MCARAGALDAKGKLKRGRAGGAGAGTRSSVVACLAAELAPERLGALRAHEEVVAHVACAFVAVKGGAALALCAVGGVGCCVVDVEDNLVGRGCNLSPV